MVKELSPQELERLNGAIDYLEKNGFHEPARSVRILIGNRRPVVLGPKAKEGLAE